jgi:hypothetical protein
MTELSEDATKVYLFVNSFEMLNAVTRRRNGDNLPVLGGEWVFKRELVLGVQEPLAAGIDPEPVLRGLRANGFFVWHDAHNPFGTSQ